MSDQPSPVTRRAYNPVILANLIAGTIFSVGNVVTIIAPLPDAATIVVLGAVNSVGLLVAFLATGALAQSRTTPIDPATGEPLNPAYHRAD